MTKAINFLIPHVHCNNCNSTTCTVFKVTYFFSVPFSLLHGGCCLGYMPTANECRLISRACQQLMGTCHKMMILIIIGIVPMVRYIKLSVSGKTLGPQLILDLISLSPSSWDPPHPPPPPKKSTF